MTSLNSLLDDKCKLISKKIISNSPIDNIQINTSDCTQSSILFYNLKTNKNVNLFKERLMNGSYGACFINHYDSSLENISNLIYINDKDWLEFQRKCLSEIYPVNWDNLKLIGVTGTNGKTTCVHLVNQILNNLGASVVSVGTLGVISNLKIIKNLNSTSPSYIDNWKILHETCAKPSVIAFEVSSHALEQDRFFKIPFDVALWTSFSQDHLDYHKSLEQYFNAKMKVRNLLKKDGKLLICKVSKDILENIKEKSDSIETIDLKILNTIPDFFKPTFNRINLALTISSLEKIGFQIPDIIISKLVPPPGRFNILMCNGNTVIIDYAHTPDAIKNITIAIKDAFKNKKLITIFGCGGNRDRTKRPLMGEAAALVSDEIVVTSDNPRMEDPKVIIQEILPGIPSTKKYLVIEDRKNAITKTIHANKGAVILIAGKGHENYMEILGQKLPYSDEEVVKEIQNDHA